MKVCIVGASGKLGRYMVQHALDRGYEVVGVCREESVGKLDAFKGRITVVPGPTDDPEVIKRAVAGCDGVLVVLVPRGVHGYSTGTAQAVLDHAPDARLVFSCGWHITLDGKDVYSWKLKALVKVFGPLARLIRFADLDDQVEACRRVFASATRWTVVRGSDLEEGESQGLPEWSRHVGDPILESNLTRRVDFALFMVEALENDELVHEAPAIVGRLTPSALAYADTQPPSATGRVSATRPMSSRAVAGLQYGPIRRRDMFTNSKAFSSFSTNDLAAAKRFYGETLGLDVVDTPEGLELRISGSTPVFVYPSDNYTAPKHTVLNFPVEDIDAAVEELTRRGVSVEHYDLPDIKTDERGILRGNGESGPRAIAWFKDPAEHVLSVLQID